MGGWREGGGGGGVQDDKLYFCPSNSAVSINYILLLTILPIFRKMIEATFFFNSDLPAAQFFSKLFLSFF